MPSHLQCQSCSKIFIYAAKLIEPQKPKMNTPEHTYSTIETYVCPFCQSPNIAEQEPEAPVQEQPSNVFVYDLKSGANPELDLLLQDGWKIVSRYAKQYMLEKFPESGDLRKPEGELKL